MAYHVRNCFRNSFRKTFSESGLFSDTLFQKWFTFGQSFPNMAQFRKRFPENGLISETKSKDIPQDCFLSPSNIYPPTPSAVVRVRTFLICCFGLATVPAFTPARPSLSLTLLLLPSSFLVLLLALFTHYSGRSLLLFFARPN